jgi:hypothetical protein
MFLMVVVVAAVLCIHPLVMIQERTFHRRSQKVVVGQSWRERCGDGGWEIARRARKPTLP